MKRLVTLAAGLALSLTVGVRTADASSILYYNDYNLGTDRMAAALVLLSGTHTTTTASSVSDFSTLLNGGGFQLAIFFQQGNSGSTYDAAFSAISTFLAGGGAAIAVDWTGNASHITPFGASFTGSRNDDVVMVGSAGLLPGVVNPVDLFNPGSGWGVFSTGMTAGVGATCGAVFSNGQCAIIITNSGRSFFNGFLSDTFSDGTEGVNLYVNEINQALIAQGAPVPEPSTMVLLGSGLLLAYSRLRRKQS